MNQLIIVVIVGVVRLIVTSPVIGVISVVISGAVIVCIIIATGAGVAGVIRVIITGVVRTIVTATSITAEITASSQSKGTTCDDGCVKEATT